MHNEDMDYLVSVLANPIQRYPASKQTVEKYRAIL